MKNTLPIIDISALVKDNGDQQSVAEAIHDACTDHGFFYISGHGIDKKLQDSLENESQSFFMRDEKYKKQIEMVLGGRAWRGFFPVGDEVTSGKPDLKEGLYFGQELNGEDSRVKAGLPMHGANLFPTDMPELRVAVLDYIEQLENLGHQLMEGLSLSLGLQSDYFKKRYTNNPLCLFRIFHYPPSSTDGNAQWGVGEHTDYGLLTILKQDNVGGLQVKVNSQWIDAPVIPDTFVCNIGDMLDRLTRGYYRSTPHRVLNTSSRDRYSFPFFFDPSFNAQINPIPLPGVDGLKDDKNDRWDQSSVHDFKGTYGDYVLGKVAKVFPQLKNNL